MQRVKSNVIWIFLVAWAGVAQVYWNLAPHLAGYNTASLHTSAYLMIKGLTLVGPDLLVILLGYYLGCHRQKAGVAIKVWLNTLILGVLLSLAIALTDNGVTNYPTTVYDSLLPVLRNGYPLLTGVIGGLLIMSALSAQMDKRRLTVLLWGLIAIPFVSPANIWGWNDNFLALFYAILFLLGGNLRPARRIGTSLVRALVSLGTSLLLQGLMPFLSFDGTTIGRFTTVTNVLTVLAAYFIAQVAAKTLHCRPVMSYLLSVLVIVTNSSVLAVLAAIAKEKPVQQSTVRTAALTIIAITIALLVAAGWQRLLATRWVQRIGRRVDSFADQDLPTQQATLIKLVKRQGPDLLVAAAAYLIALVSQLLMSSSWHIQPNVGPEYNLFSYTFTQRGLLVLLTALILFTIIRFVQALSKRYWTSLAIVILLSCLFVIANREKIAARNEPILPSDLAMLKVAGEPLRNGCSCPLGGGGSRHSRFGRNCLLAGEEPPGSGSFPWALAALLPVAGTISPGGLPFLEPLRDAVEQLYDLLGRPANVLQPAEWGPNQRPPDSVYEQRRCESHGTASGLFSGAHGTDC